MDARIQLSGVTDVYGHRTSQHRTVEDGMRLELDTESLLPLGELC